MQAVQHCLANMFDSIVMQKCYLQICFFKSFKTKQKLSNVHILIPTSVHKIITVRNSFVCVELTRICGVFLPTQYPQYSQLKKVLKQGQVGVSFLTCLQILLTIHPASRTGPVKV